MPAFALISRPSPSAADLPADVWHASALAGAGQTVVATGDALLDAQLPGGGWPVGALTELLQPAGTHSEWRLLLPVLARSGDGAVVLIDPPLLPFAPALAAQGLAAQRLLRVDAPHAAQALWASEQVLRCAEVDAVLAWLPQVRAEALRRLQIVAAEFHKLLFVVRPLQAQAEASPAVLRVVATPAADADGLQLRVLKRRGPPLETPLPLRARHAPLAALLGAAQLQRGIALSGPRDALAPAGAPVFNVWGLERALDRAAAHA